MDNKKLTMNLKVSLYTAASENAEYVLQIVTSKVKKIHIPGWFLFLLLIFTLVCTLEVV